VKEASVSETAKLNEGRSKDLALSNAWKDFVRQGIRKECRTDILKDLL